MFHLVCQVNKFRERGNKRNEGLSHFSLLKRAGLLKSKACVGKKAAETAAEVSLVNSNRMTAVDM